MQRGVTQSPTRDEATPALGAVGVGVCCVSRLGARSEGWAMSPSLCTMRSSARTLTIRSPGSLQAAR